MDKACHHRGDAKAAEERARISRDLLVTKPQTRAFASEFHTLQHHLPFLGDDQAHHTQ